MFEPTVSHVVCTDSNSVIGICGEMPWHIPEELRYFKSVTEDSIVIMGRKTFESIGSKPLSDRINVIVSKTLQPPKDNSYIVFESIEEALIHSEDLGTVLKRNVFIIGGSEVYQQTFFNITKIYLSTVSSLTKQLPYSIEANRNNLSFYIAKERLSRYFDIQTSKNLETLDKSYKVTNYILTLK